MAKHKHSTELLKDAEILADEIGRSCHLRHINNGAYRKDEAVNLIARALEKYELLLRNITAKAVDQFGRECWGGSNEWGAEENRRENIRSTPGYGYNCDLCHGCKAETFMMLRIGNYRFRATFDLCHKCTKRLAAVVDARLEDKRIKENRNED